VSWGKIRLNAESVKIYAEASLVFPLIVADTFAKGYHQEKNDKALKEKHSLN
jgi:deoxyhypusine synthase